MFIFLPRIKLRSSSIMTSMLMLSPVTGKGRARLFSVFARSRLLSWRSMMILPAPGAVYQSSEGLLSLVRSAAECIILLITPGTLRKAVVLRMTILLCMLVRVLSGMIIPKWCWGRVMPRGSYSRIKCVPVASSAFRSHQVRSWSHQVRSGHTQPDVCNL